MSSIPAKFNSSVINNFSDSELIGSLRAAKQNLDKIYANQETMAANSQAVFNSQLGFIGLGDKSHVVTHPEIPRWVFKYKRSDEVSAPDQHIYRVRKADKIRKMKLEGVMVPVKFLYKLPNGEFIVLAEKVEIVDKWQEVKIDMGNGKFMDWGKERKKLTPKQAKQIVHIIFRANATDLTPANIEFNSKGQIVLPDLEPALRNCRKKIWRWLPGALITHSHIVGVMTAQLLSHGENRKTKIAIHTKKTYELGRLLVQLAARAAISIFLAKGIAFLVAKTNSPFLNQASSIITSASKANTIWLGVCAGLAVTAHFVIPCIA